MQTSNTPQDSPAPSSHNKELGQRMNIAYIEGQAKIAAISVYRTKYYTKREVDERLAHLKQQLEARAETFERDFTDKPAGSVVVDAVPLSAIHEILGSEEE